MELSGVSPKLKGENKDSSPYPPFNVVPRFELPVENNEHPYIEWRGGGWILFSLKLPYLSTMSQQFCRRL